MHLGVRKDQTHHGKSYAALVELALRPLCAPADEASVFAIGNKIIIITYVNYGLMWWRRRGRPRDLAFTGVFFHYEIS